MPLPVSDISKFKNITAAESKLLSDAGLTTRHMVWAAAQKEDGGGIIALAKRTNIDSARLIAWLAEDALDDAKYLSAPEDKVLSRVTKRALSNLGHRWLDILVAVAVTLLVLLAYRAATARQYSMRVVVAKHGGLPAFRAITRNDVSMERTNTVDGSFAKLEDTIGKFSTEPIQQGKVLRNEQLQSDPGLLAELSCRSLLQIQLKSSLPSSDSKLPHRVWLVVARRLDVKAAQPAVLKDVFLLTVIREGEATRASIAVRPNQLQQLSTIIGSADIFVVYPPLQ
jgi:hypothetical protein